MEAKANPNQPRAAARINAKLEKNLAAYIAAAGAAGACLLAAQPAEGKVVYTPTNVTITVSGASLDLNNDGTADFSLAFLGHSSHSVALTVIPQVTGNAVRPGQPFGAAAGFFGVPVGAGEKFVSNSKSAYGLGVVMAEVFGLSENSYLSRGPWVNTTNRYLGVKFLIHGQVHYGWARFSVSKGLTTVLTGYAYETIPNVTIVEGHVSGPEKASNEPASLLAPLAQPANLGLLARGADGIAIWRRDSEVLAD